MYVVFAGGQLACSRRSVISWDKQEKRGVKKKKPEGVGEGDGLSL